MAFLKDFLQSDYVISTLIGNGFHLSEHFEQVELFRQVASTLQHYGVSEDASIDALWVPGRIEFLGKHVDYAGGKSLVAALQRGFVFLIHRTNNSWLNVIDGNSGQCIRINRDTGEQKGNYSWALYVKTVLKRVQENFSPLNVGGTISFASNIPSAAGLSSSSALVTGIFLALDTLANFKTSPNYQENINDKLALAEYLGHVENGQSFKDLPGDKGVGTMGGSQDHTAILCSRENALRMFSYRPNRLLDEVAIPDDLTFCIASSGVKAEKTRNAREDYNSCSMRVRRIISCFGNDGREGQTLENHIAQPEFTLEWAKERLGNCNMPDDLYNRLYQYYHETRHVVPGALTALKNRDYRELGKVTTRSQELAEEYLGNQVKETSFLARTAPEEGALAGSAFGAGFGGGVWALVKKNEAEAFSQRWMLRYHTAFAGRNDSIFFIDNTGPPAGIL